MVGDGKGTTTTTTLKANDDEG